MKNISIGLNNVITILAHGFLLSSIFIAIINLFNIIDVTVSDVKDVNLAAFIAGSIVILLLSCVMFFLKRKHLNGDSKYTPLNKVLNFINFTFSVIILTSSVSIIVYKWIVNTTDQVGFWQNMTVLVLSFIVLITSLANTFYINRNKIWSFIARYDLLLYILISIATVIAVFIIIDPRAVASKVKDEKILRVIYGAQLSINSSTYSNQTTPKSLDDIKDELSYNGVDIEDIKSNNITYNIKSDNLTVKQVVKDTECINRYIGYGYSAAEIEDTEFCSPEIKFQGALTYELCAEFGSNAEYEDEAKYWNHGKGKQCFTMTHAADKSLDQKVIYPEPSIKSSRVNTKMESHYNDPYEDEYSDEYDY